MHLADSLLKILRNKMLHESDPERIAYYDAQLQKLLQLIREARGDCDER